MTHPIPVLFGLALGALLAVGGLLNSACKTSAHSWCAPPPPAGQGITRIRKSDKLISPAISRVSSVSPR
jgi:hypothetical protein